ncbi:acyl-CoA dehydrogenase family protein [Aldersonia sp. NBC_00410]|uniref:acyl-CoA dehydrogenase family protein n=1 Tax=Aldersonia sp. NBC_00410 TaxID=2975954 RepID=UPI0022524E31|nr:acyl-CoA dehydrogenase family protein [Aldersonia sp. NBC_00410]MCX5043488.1 acyl-CoA dehydrogenase family protein [Aldersonia sp. NBC_00410]
MTDLAEAADAVTVGSPKLRDLIADIGAGAIGRDERDELPFKVIDAVKRARLGALRLPVEHGGGGATLVELYEVFIELSAADSNVAHILRSHFGIVESLLLADRPEDQRWLDLVARGDLIGGVAAEPESKAGAIAESFSTAITETPEGLRLNGTKHYTTGALYMDWLTVGATDVDGSKARLIIPTDRDGLVRHNDWDGFGQRFTASGTTTFDNVAVYPGDYVPAPVTPRYPSTFFHIQLSAMIAGILRRVTSDAVDQVRNKKRAFYHATAEVPADDPILHYSVGLLASQAFAAEAMVGAAAAALQEAYAAHGTPEEDELSLRASLLNAKAKVVIDELANRAASEIFDVGGGSLTHRSAHLDRHWRNIRTIAAHNPKTLKAVAVGNYHVNGTPLPNQGFF